MPYLKFRESVIPKAYPNLSLKTNINYDYRLLNDSI